MSILVYLSERRKTAKRTFGNTLLSPREIRIVFNEASTEIGQKSRCLLKGKHRPDVEKKVINVLDDTGVEVGIPGGVSAVSIGTPAERLFI